MITKSITGKLWLATVSLISLTSHSGYNIMFLCTGS